jgi:hypothetical protein
MHPQVSALHNMGYTADEAGMFTFEQARVIIANQPTKRQVKLYDSIMYEIRVMRAVVDLPEEPALPKQRPRSVKVGALTQPGSNPCTPTQHIT